MARKSKIACKNFRDLVVLATMGDKSVETLNNKIEFLSISVTFSPFPQNNVDFSGSSTAQTTAPTQH